MKPEFYKPFDLDAARSGAPFCGINGEQVRVLIWDRKHPTHPIIVIEERGEQEAVAFRKDGLADVRDSLGVVNQLVMLPLGLIDGKPVFVGDRLLDAKGQLFIVEAGQVFGPGCLCKWAPPEKAYPETHMKPSDLYAVPGVNEFWAVKTLECIANAALRHAIDAGQVVDVDQSAEAVRKAYADGQAIAFKHEAGGRAARDMLIAVSVRNAAYVQAMNCPSGSEGVVIREIDLAAIIATVQ